MTRTDEITYRSPVPADAGDWHRLNRIVAEHAGAEFRDSPERFAREFDNPVWCADTDGRLAMRSGQIVGGAHVVAPPAGGTQVHGSGAVDPSARGLGIGSALVTWSIALRRYEPALDRQFYRAHIEAFRDHWGYQPRPYDAWQRRIADPGFRADLTSLALTASGEIAGYVMALAEDPTHIEFQIVGTRRPWRGRGVASALIAESLRAARAAGIEVVGLGVDSENPTGALGVYETMGFAVRDKFSIYSIIVQS